MPAEVRSSSRPRPQMGEVTLNRERSTIHGADDSVLVIHHPDAGSSDARKLSLLAAAALPAADRRAGAVRSV